MGGVFRETAARAGEAADFGAVLGGEIAERAAVGLAAAARHAAARFAERLRAGKPRLDFFEGGEAALHREFRQMHPRRALDGAKDRGPLVVVHRLQRDRGGSRLPGHRFAGEVLVDGGGGHSPVGHRPDGEVRAENGVAAGENAGQVGRHGMRVGRDAPGRYAQPFGLGGGAFHRLAGGGDRARAFHGKIGILDRLGPATAGCVGIAQAHAPAREGQRPVLPFETHGSHQVFDAGALGLGALHLFHQAGHLLPGAPVKDAHAGPQADGGSGAVHGGVAASQHDHVPADVGRGPLGNLREKPDARQCVLFSGAAQRLRPLRPDGDEHGVVFRAQPGQREVRAPAPVHAEGCAQGAHGADLGVERLAGQPVGGNAVAQHPPGQGVGVVQRARVAALPEVVRGRESRGSRADDGHGPAGGRRLRRRGGLRRGQVQVRDVAVQRADGQSLVERAPAAILFAQPGTDAAERAGQRQTLGDHAHRMGRIPGGDAGHEARDVQPGRAARNARRPAFARVVGEQQFDGHLPCPAHILAPGVDRHPVGDGHGARRRERSAPLDLDRAEEAGGRRLDARDVAQCGDADPEAFRRLQHRGPFRDRGRPSVDGALDRHTTSTASSGHACRHISQRVQIASSIVCRSYGR